MKTCCEKCEGKGLRQIGMYLIRCRNIDCPCHDMTENTLEKIIEAALTRNKLDD